VWWSIKQIINESPARATASASVSFSFAEVTHGDHAPHKLAFLRWGHRSIHVCLSQRGVNILDCQLVDNADLLLNALSFYAHLQVEVALQLDCLLLLGLAIRDLVFILHLLPHDSFFLELNLADVSLHLFLSFQLLVVFFFVEKWPSLVLLLLV